MGNRGTRMWAVPAVLLVAQLAGACGGNTATTVAPTPTQPASTAAASATPEPTLMPSGEAALEAEARRIVESLGGTVPSEVRAEFTYGDSDAAASSVNVALGDWQLAWDSKHVLRHVFWEQSLEGPTPAPTALGPADVRVRVAALVAALGLQPGDPKELVAQEEAWMAAWPRVVDGVPAEENGTRVWVNKDGSFLQYSFGWNELGPKPTTVITAEQATAAVEDCKNGAACEASLVWHLPASAEADGLLTLCWIVGPKGGNGDWRAWVDAGTGQVVDVAARLD